MSSKKLANNPILARIKSDHANLPTGVTSSGSLSAYAQNATAQICDNRDREKREIAELNNRLAKYIETVRFLEAQNRVLENDIGLFRSAAHLHAERVSVYYDAEKNSLYTLLRATSDKATSAKQNINKLEPEVVTARKNWGNSIDQYNSVRENKKKQMKHLSEIEAENAYVKRLINDCEEEKRRINGELVRIRGEIKRVIALRDKELGSARFKTQELLKKINGSISKHEISIREEISNARRDTNDKNREYFHKELNSAMREIRDQFEIDSRKTRKTWEEWYKEKIIAIKKGSDRFSTTQNKAREEVLRIRSYLNELHVKMSDADTVNQQLVKKIENLRYREEEDLKMFEIALIDKENAVIKMREECTKLSVELDKLYENQITLRNEISHYSKLIDNAENARHSYPSNFTINTPAPALRTTSYHSYGSAFTMNVRDTNDHIVKSDNYNFSTSNNSSNNNADFSTINDQQFKSFSKRDIKIVAHNDEALVLENSNFTKSHDLSNWKIHHYAGGALVGTYIFPVATHIQPHQKISIHSMTSRNLLADHTAYLINSFNFSKDTKTVLMDDADEEVGWYAHLTYSH